MEDERNEEQNREGEAINEDLLELERAFSETLEALKGALRVLIQDLSSKNKIIEDAMLKEPIENVVEKITSDEFLTQAGNFAQKLQELDQYLDDLGRDFAQLDPEFGRKYPRFSVVKGLVKKHKNRLRGKYKTVLVGLNKYNESQWNDPELMASSLLGAREDFVNEVKGFSGELLFHSASNAR